jgi:ATP-dependent helicase HrpB
VTVLAPLPIDSVLPALIRALREKGRAVLEAPPGAGKTTRVPTAIADAFPHLGAIWVLEPRRLAARTAARRVAEERGSPLGTEVGYRVRFDDRTTNATRIVFATEGVVLERLRRDPQLRGIDALVFDEFHERHLDGDLILGLAMRLSQKRKLMLCVMSATLDGTAIAEHLQAPRLTSEGRRYPVEVSWRPLERDEPLERGIAAAARTCLQEPQGDVLCFLPGAREIRLAEKALGERVGEFDVVPLHGDLPPEAQDRAIKPGPRRKIILSTNVAETSVTIEGVRFVVDSGLARVASHSPWTGLPTLMVKRISRASATQRAGRAGRLGPGRCLRLYSQHDHDARPEHDLPEVVRADLSEAALLFAVDDLDPADFPWLTAPPEAALQAARGLLERLEAIDGSGHATPLGRRLAAMPLHPRLGRLLISAAERGAGAAGAAIAAMLSSGSGVLTKGARRAADVDGAADVLEELERLRAVSVRDRVDFDRARHEGLDLGRLAEVDRGRKQLERLVPPSTRVAPPGTADEDDALLHALLAAFPDRVARRKSPRGTDVIFCEGGNGKLDAASVVRSELLIAYDVTERGAQGGASVGRMPESATGVIVRGAARLEADWLLEAQLARIADERAYEWNRSGERVDEVRRMRYGAVVIEETRAPARLGASAEGDHAIAACLGAAVEEALHAGGGGLGELREALARVLDRAAFLATAMPELELPPIPEPGRGNDEDRVGLKAIFASAAEGRSRFDEVASLSARDLVAAWLPVIASRIDRDAPDFVQLPGRRARVEYPRGQTPHVASRLQDFFGLAEGPKIAGGRVALVLHLLAPNQRAVQVTQDLAGFWTRNYPQLRKELGRRYPRHKWPEDPLRPAVVS